MLEATHAGLRRLRLMRRRPETLRTTARGRELLNAPEALLRALQADMGGAGRFDDAAWRLLEAALLAQGALDVGQLTETLRPALHAQGWRASEGDRSTSSRCGTRCIHCSAGPRATAW